MFIYDYISFPLIVSQLTNNIDRDGNVRKDGPYILVDSEIIRGWVGAQNPKMHWHHTHHRETLIINSTKGDTARPILTIDCTMPQGTRQTLNDRSHSIHAGLLEACDTKDVSYKGYECVHYAWYNRHHTKVGNPSSSFIKESISFTTTLGNRGTWQCTCSWTRKTWKKK